MRDRIPAVNIVGPGSQPAGDEEVSDYMHMPREMSTFATPTLPDPENVGDITAALDLLECVRYAMQHYGTAPSKTLFDLYHIDEVSLELINQILGAGEVSIGIDGASPIEIQESVMAGLWRIRHLDDSGQLVGDYLEVAAVPSAVRQLTFQSASAEVNTSVVDAPEGIINSPALLVELDEKVKNYTADCSPHVINLSLLPLSPQDLTFLGRRLGVGPVTILSRGYGNCRIGSTACKSVWWIKYFNSEDALILNTIEVVDVPEVALAASEDIADSADRLGEIMELYQ